MTVGYDVAPDVLTVERHGVTVAFRQASRLAPLVLAALEDAAFRDAIAAHRAGTATGAGRCAEVTMAFLNAVGHHDNMRAYWARQQPSGRWHTWPELHGETFEIDVSGPALLLVVDVKEFRAVRGIGESDELRPTN
jgi:hypothetical protein